MKLIKKYIFVPILFFCLIINCNTKNYKRYSKQQYSMGTVLEVTFYSYNKKEALKILNKCFEIADELEKKVSCRLNESVIFSLNNKKELLIENDFILDLIIDSVNLSEFTHGAFDPSLYHLIDLWGFESGEYKVPDNLSIQKSLKKSGYKNIIINGNAIKLKNNVSLDLGAIAKGRIIGAISKFLKENGIKDFLINGGGDLVVKGKFEGKRLWRIAVLDPFERNKLIGVIELTDCSVVTSGDYERNFIGKDGKIYHHIIDPKTGYPADNEVHSVTVITDEPGKADALATALFVMGVKKGLDLTNKNSDINVIFITGDKENKKISVSKDVIKNKESSNYWNFILKKNK